MKYLKQNGWWLAGSAAMLVLLVGLVSEFAGLPGRDSIYFNDFSILTYQVEAARRFHEATGLLWGYDPHFMGGYPLGFIWNSNIALQWLGVRFGGLTAGAVVFRFFITGLALFPLSWWVSARVMGFSRGESGGAFLLGGLYFLVGIPAMFFLGGMLTAGAVTYFSILAAAFIYRYSRDGGLWWAGVAVVVPLAIFIHKTAIVILLPCACFALVWVLARRRWLRLAGLFAAAAVAFIFNYQWIHVVMASMTYSSVVREAPFWTNFDVLRPLKDYFTGSMMMNMKEFGGAYGAVHSVVLCGLLAAGAAGFAGLWKRGERTLALYAGVCGTAILVYSYYGSFLPGGDMLNPARYFPVAQLWFALPGGVALASFAASRGKSSIARTLAVYGIVVVVIACSFYAHNRLRQVRYLLARQPGQEIEALCGYIKALPPGARIMIEDSGDMDAESGGQVYGKSQVLSHFGLRTGREFVGGPYPYVFLKYHRVSFQDGRAFGQKISDISPEEMKARLELYNVKWIICWSDSARSYFSKFTGYFMHRDRVGRFDVFELPDYEPNYLIGATARVEADYSRIRVSGLRAEGRTVTLKYNWVEFISAEPGMVLYKCEEEKTPAGIICIDNPAPDFTLSMPRYDK
ncbi:MAG TPA: hypothetical protein PLN69_06150 [bacterium]|nr:hypothetical protein [bacterium]